MPLYEYACEACGHRCEVIQSLSDAPLTVCEKCGGKLEKLLSSSAIQFKGSGWYVTDYAKKGASASETESKSTEGKSETASGDKGAESKTGKDASQADKATPSDTASSTSKK